MKQIELGGGKNPVLHPNADKNPGPTVDIVTDLEEPLPLPSNEYDFVFSRYSIEHISWRKVQGFIKEVYRITAPRGTVQVITANLLEQCKVVANSADWDPNFSTMIFGDQDYSENTHRVGFSPAYAEKLFKEAGFSQVSVHPLPECKTDMVIDAWKFGENKTGEPEIMSKETEKEYGRTYFDGSGGGYQFEGYRDFATHWRMVYEEILPLKPESVLDVAGARGYIVRKLENEGIRAVCMDISKHCQMTRVTDSWTLHDVTVAPWPFKDKEFDLVTCFSFMEHLPENKIDLVIKEMKRVSKRALLTITFEKTPQDKDVTHKTFMPLDWWIHKFQQEGTNPSVDGWYSENPDFRVKIPTKTEADYGPVHMGKYAPADGLVKLNIGSFTECYYGWKNIDILDLNQWAAANGYIFFQQDVTRGLPEYPDNSVNIILAQHFLEHFTRSEGKTFLRECFRVLKPRGVIRISVPDTELICESYSMQYIKDFGAINVGVDKAADRDEALYELLFSGHKTLYSAASVMTALGKAGFVDTQLTGPFKSRSEAILKQTNPTYAALSCYVEANKPETPILAFEPKVELKDMGDMGRYLRGELIEGKQ